MYSYTILAETTTFGVKYWPVDRKVLTRKLVQKKTKRGSVTFKVGYDSNGKAIKAVLENYDSMKLIGKNEKPFASN